MAPESFDVHLGRSMPVEIAAKDHGGTLGRRVFWFSVGCFDPPEGTKMSMTGQVRER